MPVDPNLIGTYLEAALKSKRPRPTYYKDVASHFGLPEFDGAFHAHPLSQIFEVLDQQDAIANRPFRTSVVVAVTTNRPGQGFYEALERLKGKPDPKTDDAREQLWLSELNDAYRYPWP
jgi:hypothetical protein